ncbi:MAG: hypothetical protein V4507_04075 [Verrucomicrobiota bacterium]
MKYLIKPLYLTVLWLLQATLSAHAQILIDDFNSYTNGGSIGTTASSLPWSRSGVITTSGITGTSDSNGGIAAAYNVNFALGAAGTAGTIKYTFGTTQDLTLNNDIKMDFKVSSSLPDTIVVAQISNGVTTYQTTLSQSLTNTTYSTYSFIFDTTTTTKTAGTDSLSTVLAGTQSVYFRFSNSSGTGSQSIRFDNFIATAIPEPRNVGLSLCAAMLLLFAISQKFAWNRSN